jgi:hypothetical protein
MNNSHKYSSQITKAKLFVCNLIGHWWRYKRLYEQNSLMGNNYNFTKVRSCVLCDQQQYKYGKWVIVDKQPVQINKTILPQLKTS